MTMASRNEHGRRGGSFEANTYRDAPHRPSVDDRVTDRGGQPGGTHYYADRDDRPADDRNHGYGFEDAGVGPHYGKGPQGFVRSDERILELVCEALHDDDQVDATHITVEVVRGAVTLGGMVDDHRMKPLAEDCVKRVACVKAIENRIEVRQLHG
jgi:hypothetical protein